MDVGNSGLALVISSVKGEIYPLDLAGIDLLTVSLRKWKKNNLGCHLLLADGKVLDIVSATEKSSSWLNRVATAISLSTAKLDLILEPTKLPFDELKSAICEGVKDYVDYFAEDPEEEWSLLKCLTSAPMGQI